MNRELSLSKMLMRFVETMADQFKVKLTFVGSFLEFFKGLSNHSMSPQITGLWLAGIAALIWGIWITRNASKIYNKEPNQIRLKHAISSWIQEEGVASKGIMFNTLEDLMITKCFGVQCNYSKPPKIIEVTWHPPLSGWIKYNTDGLCKDTGKAAYGGPFQKCRGFVCGVFVENLGRRDCLLCGVLRCYACSGVGMGKGLAQIMLEMDPALLTLKHFF